MKLYGLYSDKQKCLMATSYNSNSEDFSVSISVSLSKWYPGDDDLWTTPHLDTAEEISVKGPTKWYNADYSSPRWDLELYGKLDVVDLNTWEIDNIIS